MSNRTEITPPGLGQNPQAQTDSSKTPSASQQVQPRATEFIYAEPEQTERVKRPPESDAYVSGSKTEFMPSPEDPSAGPKTEYLSEPSSEDAPLKTEFISAPQDTGPKTEYISGPQEDQAAGQKTQYVPAPQPGLGNPGALAGTHPGQIEGDGAGSEVMANQIHGGPVGEVEVMSGPSAGTICPLGQKSMIGRSPDCTVHLRDASVSAVHVAILRIAGFCWLLDWNSRSGVSVNERAVDWVVLKDGDLIRLGGVELRFRGGDFGKGIILWLLFGLLALATIVAVAYLVLEFVG